MELPSKLVLIPLMLIVIVGIVLIFLLVGGDDEPAKVETGVISAKDLRVGNCIADANSNQGDVTTFDAVKCTKPHDGEVFTIIKLAGKKYRGTQFVTSKGQRGCRARLRRQATRKAIRNRRLGFKFVYPTKQSWAQGDREITCLATYRKPRTGALEQR
jgi:hypothetical protein